MKRSRKCNHTSKGSSRRENMRLSKEEISREVNPIDIVASSL